MVYGSYGPLMRVLEFRFALLLLFLPSLIFFSLLSAIYRPKCESTAERERARALASIFLVCTLSDVNVHVIKPRKTAN